MSTEERRLGRPNLLGSGEHFGRLTLGLLCSDVKGALIAKAVLDSLGCRAVMLLRSVEELRERHRRQPIDILVFDLCMDLSAELAWLSLLRTVPHLDVLPVICLGRKDDVSAIETARDAGADEWVSKPFTANALLSAVFTVIENRRPFIIAATYRGPCRRTSSTFSQRIPLKPYGRCRRRENPVVVSSESDGKGDGRVIVLPANHSLKEKMGLPVPSSILLPDGTVERAEHTLDDAKALFVESVQSHVSELLTYTRLLLRRPDRTDETIGAMRMTARLIEARTRDLGYRRVPEVARLLREFCDEHFVVGDDTSFMLLEKHALTLMAMLRGGERAEAGASGDSLLKDLARQVQEYRTGRPLK